MRFPHEVSMETLRSWHSNRFLVIKPLPLRNVPNHPIRLFPVPSGGARCLYQLHSGVHDGRQYHLSHLLILGCSLPKLALCRGILGLPMQMSTFLNGGFMEVMVPHSLTSESLFSFCPCLRAQLCHAICNMCSQVIFPLQKKADCNDMQTQELALAHPRVSIRS